MSDETPVSASLPIISGHLAELPAVQKNTWPISPSYISPTPEPLPEVVSTILASPDADVPPDKLLELLKIWKAKVEREIADYDEEKNKIFVVYKRQKDMYDKWLSGRLKKMKKFDNLINGRKKVLIDVNKEIDKLAAILNPPPPS